MPNKRFLGLGFTFSATDRGLEKKLLGIQSALSGITDSLTKINSEAGTASSAMGAIKAPKVGGRASPSRSRDSSVSLLSELTSINKSIDKGYADVLKGMDRSYKLASSSSKLATGLLGKDKSDPKAGDVASELTGVSRSIDKGFGKVLSSMDSSDKMLSSHLKNNALLFGGLIGAIEKIDLDIKIPNPVPQKPDKSLLIELGSINKSIVKIGEHFITFADRLALPPPKRELKKKESVIDVREERLRKDSAYLGLLLSSQTKLTGDTNKLLKDIKVDLKKSPKVFANLQAPISAPKQDAALSFKMETSRLKTSWSKLNQESQEFFNLVSQSVKTNFGADISKAFNRSMQEMTIAIDSTGRVSKSTVLDLKHMVDEFGKTSTQTDKVVKSFNNLEKAFEAVKGWFSDIRSATDHFFHTIGVDLSQMIPEQFQAIYGVINATLLKPIKAGLLGVGRYLFGSFKKSKSEEYTYKVWKSIGPGMNPTNNLQALMNEVAQNTRPKKQTTLMDIFGILLAPLALVVGLLVGFAETISKITKAFGQLKFVRKLGDAFTRAIEAFKELGPIKRLGQEIEMAVLWFKDLSVVKNVGEIFGKIGARISEGIEAFKAFKPISKTIEFVEKAFEGIGKFISKTVAKVISFGEALFKLGSKFKPLFESPIFKAVFGFGKAIGKLATWVFIAIDVFRGITKALKESTGVIDFFGKALFNIVDNVLMGIPSFLIDKLSKAFGGMSDSMKTGLIAVFGGLAAVIAAPFLGISAPVIALGAALVAAGVLITGAVKGIVSNFHFVTDGLSKLWTGVKDFFSGFIDLASAFLTNFSQLASSFSQLTQEFAKAHPIIGGMIEAVGSLFSGLKDGIQSVVDFISKISSMFTEKFGGALGWVGDKLSGFGKSMSDQAKTIDKSTDQKKKDEKAVSLPLGKSEDKGALVVNLDDYRNKKEQKPQKPETKTADVMNNVVSFKNSKNMQSALGYDTSAKDMMNPKMVAAVNNFNATADKLNANKTASRILDQGGSIEQIDQLAAKQTEMLDKAKGMKGPGQDQTIPDSRALSDLLDGLHKAKDTEEMKALLQAQLQILQQQLQQTQTMIQELQRPKSVSGKLSIKSDQVGMNSKAQLDGAHVGAGGS